MTDAERKAFMALLVSIEQSLRNMSDTLQAMLEIAEGDDDSEA